MGKENENTNMGEWEKCPRCCSNRVKEDNKWYQSCGCITVLIIMTVVVSALATPIAGILFLVIGSLFAGISIIDAIKYRGKTNLECEDCEFKWIYPYEGNKDEEEEKEKK